MTSDEDRWAQAHSLLDGTPSEAVRQRLRRAQLLNLLVVLGGVLVSFALLAAIDAWNGSGSGSDDEPLWRTVTGLVVMLAGLVLAVPVAVRQLKDYRGARNPWRTPLLVLRLAQRRQLARQVSGREPADPAHLPLARHLAGSLIRHRVQPRIAGGFLLLAVGQLISSLSLWWTVALVVLGIAWPLGNRSTRRAQAFLDAHPAESVA